MATTYRRIEAVSKAGEIIKYLGNQKGPASGADIATALNMQVGTVMCHLATLEDFGFVKQTADGWQIGLGLALIYNRVRINLESQRDRINRDLESLGGDN